MIAGKYVDYAVVAGSDSKQSIWYEPRPPFEVLKVHVRIMRVPSLKQLQVKHFADSTATDRAEIASWNVPITVEAFERAGKFKKRKSSAGVWYFYMNAGSLIDDPLANLELEMMADLAQMQDPELHGRGLPGVQFWTGA